MSRKDGAAISLHACVHAVNLQVMKGKEYYRNCTTVLQSQKFDIM
jgi:hypothetical protein